MNYDIGDLVCLRNGSFYDREDELGVIVGKEKGGEFVQIMWQKTLQEGNAWYLTEEVIPATSK
jgi:hypothetical protein